MVTVWYVKWWCLFQGGAPHRTPYLSIDFKPVHMKRVNTCESLLPLPYRDSCPTVINSKKGHNFRNFKKHMIVFPWETPHGNRVLVKEADLASASISLGTLGAIHLHSTGPLLVQVMREEAILWFTHCAQLRPLAVVNKIAYCRFNSPHPPPNLLALSKKWLEKGQSKQFHYIHIMYLIPAINYVLHT